MNRSELDYTFYSSFSYGHPICLTHLIWPLYYCHHTCWLILCNGHLLCLIWLTAGVYTMMCSCDRFIIMYRLECKNCMCWQQCFGIYFPISKAMSVINSTMTPLWVHKQFTLTMHTLFYFVQNIMCHKCWNKRLPHIESVSHSFYLHSCGDVIIDYPRHYGTWQLSCRYITYDTKLITYCFYSILYSCPKLI